MEGGEIMFKVRNIKLFFSLSIACLFFLIFIPVDVFSQDSKSQLSTSSFERSQKNSMEEFFARYNGCSWLRTPYDRSCDISLELKDRTLVLYRYLKSEEYCIMTSNICFTNWELMRIDVKGFETISTDKQGNEFRILIEKNGETITILGKDNLGFRENVLGTFVKIFCSEKK